MNLYSSISEIKLWIFLSGFSLSMYACLSFGQVPVINGSQLKNNNDASNIIKSALFYPLEKDGSDYYNKGTKFNFNNIRFKRKAMFSDGTYDAESNDSDYNAILQIPSLNYKKFSISTFFFPVRWGNEPVIAGGQDYRWFIIEREWKTLRLTLNNKEYNVKLPGLKVLTNQWNSLVLSWNLDAKTIFISLNNDGLVKVILPNDFKLNVFDGKGNSNNKDKKILFTNYSIGSTFKGYIRNMRFYDRPLSENEIVKLNKYLQEERTSLPPSDSLILELPAQNKNYYFLGNISAFREEWFSKHLQAMTEPPLHKNNSNLKEQYRFLWLRTFQQPVAIRISKGEKIILRMIVLSGKGGYAPGKVKYDKTTEISNEEWGKFIKLIDKCAFWQMPAEESFQGFDGSEWILEGYRNNEYHVACRWSPEMQTKVRELIFFNQACLYLLKLSSIATPEK